jgi:hypothetical protein
MNWIETIGLFCSGLRQGDVRDVQHLVEAQILDIDLEEFRQVLRQAGDLDVGDQL